MINLLYIMQFCYCNLMYLRWVNLMYTVKINMLYLINKIVATDYKQYYLLN